MNDLTQNELLKNFIGSEKKYIHYCENNSKIAFNWAAFLFGIYWLLYRKMYLYAFCMLIIATFLILVLLLSGINQHYFMSACLILNLIFNVTLGFWGNTLYRNFALAKVKKYMNNPRYSPEFFALYGGVTWGVPIIVLLAYSLFLFMSVAPLLMPKPQPVAIHVIEFG